MRKRYFYRWSEGRHSYLTNATPSTWDDRAIATMGIGGKAPLLHDFVINVDAAVAHAGHGMQHVLMRQTNASRSGPSDGVLSWRSTCADSAGNSL